MGGAATAWSLAGADSEAGANKQRSKLEGGRDGGSAREKELLSKRVESGEAEDGLYVRLEDW
ncbi:hypothetical protein ColLi_00518 [Colletotrichum liriopes]|uniref:Uncharacterized protein n=1 Tax=Colletotrichum liriopes TaxID=708192 RepID=A0AA37LM52_9PEZI|nr:hypothetical protein ColLi_00518 [Colletotrichum liriopes]